MLSRALSLAAVTLLIECLAVLPAQAQNQNLEAGKSPSQIFTGICTACHKSPRGLLKTVPPGSLAGFLRQHYTTSGDMASLLSGFLISNGAADAHSAGQPGRDARQETKPSGPDQLDRFGGRLRAGVPHEPARSDAGPQQAPRNAGALQAEPGQNGRSSRRLAKPGEGPDAAQPAEGQVPVQSAREGLPDGLKSSKQRLGKRGKPPVEDSADLAKSEPAKTEPGTAPPREEPAKSEPTDDGQRPAQAGGISPEDAKAPEGTSAAKIEPAKEGVEGESSAPRADPASPVAPGSGAPEAAAAVAAAMPPPPPVVPAGPPAPPISQ
jgi:hypothetical protein